MEESFAFSILQRNFVCDGHADTLSRAAFAGVDLTSGSGTEGFHTDLDRMEAGGVNLQIMAIWFPPDISWHQSTVTAMWIAQVGHRAVDHRRGRLQLVTNTDALRRCKSQRNSGILLSLEGASPLLGDLDVVEMFFRFGIRALGLTHNENTAAAGGCDPSGGNRMGLTDFGRELVARMEELGMVTDAAHLSWKAFDDLMQVAKRPVVNSHCGCAHFVNRERNMTDDQLRALAATGGLAAITFVPDLLSHAHISEISSVDVFRHLEHAVEVCGIDHVGIGSDFDGASELPTNLQSVLDLPRLVNNMVAAGWTEEDVAKVLGGNWFRVLSQVLPPPPDPSGATPLTP